MVNDILNRIDLTSWDMLVDDMNVFGAVKYVLLAVMGDWFWVILSITTLVAVYVRTQSLGYTAAMGLVMTLLLTEMPVYLKIIYYIVVLGLAIVLFKVFGKRDA